MIETLYHNTNIHKAHHLGKMTHHTKAVTEIISHTHTPLSQVKGYTQHRGCKWKFHTYTHAHTHTPHTEDTVLGR